MKDKELIISWFKEIAENLDKHFPTRFHENLDGHRGGELGAVNSTVTKCKDCIEYIEKFM